MSNLDSNLGTYGNRGYRAAQLEAGILLGKMNLCAYVLEIGASGITFYDDAITDLFSLLRGRRAANLWIGAMRDLGLMQKLAQRVPCNYDSYVVTRRDISELLYTIERDYRAVCLERQTEDSPENILEKIRVKGKLSSTEQCAEAR